MTELFSLASPVPYVLVSALLLGLAWGLLRVSAWCRSVVEGSAKHVATLDGLRGFLALGVFFHHAVIAYFAHHGAAWQDPPSPFYALLGHVGVSLFFMITGFLFWDKALRAHGKMDVKALWWGRVKRLVPAYALSVVLVALAMMLPYGVHHLSELSWRELSKIVQFKGIRAASDINGVYWTLVWEWKFYILLPLVALSVRVAKGWGVLLPCAVVVAYVLWKPDAAVVLNFIGGAAVAQWRASRYRDVLPPSLALHAVALVSLVAVFVLFDRGYGAWQSVLYTVFFAALVAGCSFGGLLTSRPAVLLGAISYSIYLMHCIVLYVGLHSISHFMMPVVQLTPAQYWTAVMGIAVAVVLAALLSYRVAEQPFLRVRSSNFT